MIEALPLETPLAEKPQSPITQTSIYFFPAGLTFVTFTHSDSEDHRHHPSNHQPSHIQRFHPHHNHQVISFTRSSIPHSKPNLKHSHRFSCASLTSAEHHDESLYGMTRLIGLKLSAFEKETVTQATFSHIVNTDNRIMIPRVEFPYRDSW